MTSACCGSERAANPQSPKHSKSLENQQARTFRRVALAAAATTLLLLAMACGGDTSSTTTTVSDDDTNSEFALGEPADPADADRTIEIATLDSFAFEPAELTVTAGETVTFRIVNDGSLLHDFTLDGQATQDDHEAEMAGMEGMAHDQPNVVTISAGETIDLSWTFTEAGTVLIGCHQPGHYAGGMKGQISVEG